MLEVAQDLSLLNGLLLLLLSHVLHADLLDDQEFTCRFLPDQISLSEGAFSQEFLPLVDLVLGL